MIIWNGPPNGGMNTELRQRYSRLTRLSRQTCHLLSADSGLWLSDLTYSPPKLVELNLTGISSLEAVSCRLPRTIRKAIFQGCTRFKRIRRALPEGLETLDLSDCRQLEQLPRLPSSLKSLSVRNCQALRVIPPLPAARLTCERPGRLTTSAVH